MKPTNQNLANYYNLTRQTIATYKKEKPLIYKALLNQFLRDNQEGL